MNVREISGMWASRIVETMLPVVGIEVSAGRRERRFASADGVNVEPMRAWGKLGQITRQEYAKWRFNQGDGADCLASLILHLSRGFVARRRPGGSSRKQAEYGAHNKHVLHR